MALGPIDVRAGLEFEENHLPQGLVIKHVDVVLVAHHLPKLGAHLATALASLNVHNFAPRSSLKSGRTREKKGGEERRNIRNSACLFGTGNRIYRWRAREYPERENEVVLTL